ncbi:Lipopolysaccharide export system ATP-binding protein LptB [Variovorax sp. SRS16]|uniref:ABC transporter ATP-binding protein n=1 Tax=Variovorax sp. SRS16 TaxID=282217 RepID=UPI001316244B|nr:ABC transporter ATP-binding protein [Variovorax sp. SRS16]VTU22684.1 Lipopolysaccharide export system ATP-binding protein LptB [Variovorax sp. SRS16]
MSRSTILSIEDIGKNFAGFHALSGVNLQVGENSVHALIGPNGAGKSTLLNVVSGHLAPSAGRVMFQGRSICGRPPHETARRGVARSFQITSIFAGFSVFENVQMALLAQHGLCTRMFRPAAPMLRDEALALLQLVRLDGQAERIAGELAAGDRKRLEFAIAMAGRPKVMLLDEPTAGMSPDERAIVIHLIRSINRERGVAVLFTEHDIEMVFAIADRITVLHQGSCIADGAPAAVRADRRVQEVYLGEDDDEDAALH